MTGVRTVSVVTGGVQGIGRAIVTAFHARGDMVIVLDRIPRDDDSVAALPKGTVYHSVDISHRH